MKYYQFQKCQTVTSGARKLEIYRFKNDFNDKYIVEVFHYNYNVYAIKFYLKKHRLSKKRYSLTYNKDYILKKGFCTGNTNFFKVMNTVLKISIEILKENEKASFGFMGAPKPNEENPKLNGNNINPDGTIANTKRYKIYLSYVKRYFNPKDFEYIDGSTASIVLLKNKKNAVLTKSIAEQYIVKEIIPEL